MLTSFNYQEKWLCNIGNLSPYVDDTMEDPSDLRSNPSEEGEVDARACDQGHPEDHQGK